MKYWNPQWHVGFLDEILKSSVACGVPWWNTEIISDMWGSLMKYWNPQWHVGFLDEILKSSVACGVPWWNTEILSGMWGSLMKYWHHQWHVGFLDEILKSSVACGVPWWNTEIISGMWGSLMKYILSFDWGFYVQLASEAIFRARVYSHNLFSPVMMITWWVKLGGNRPLGDNPLLFSISGTGSFICQVAQTRLNIPKPQITQSRSTEGKAEVFSSASGTWTDNASVHSPTRKPTEPDQPPLNEIHAQRMAFTIYSVYSGEHEQQAGKPCISFNKYIKNVIILECA